MPNNLCYFLLSDEAGLFQTSTCHLVSQVKILSSYPLLCGILGRDSCQATSCCLFSRHVQPIRILPAYSLSMSVNPGRNPTSCCLSRQGSSVVFSCAARQRFWPAYSSCMFTLKITILAFSFTSIQPGRDPSSLSVQPVREPCQAILQKDCSARQEILVFSLPNVNTYLPASYVESVELVSILCDQVGSLKWSFLPSV